MSQAPNKPANGDKENQVFIDISLPVIAAFETVTPNRNKKVNIAVRTPGLAFEKKLDKKIARHNMYSPVMK
jgi:hypothetical protein